MALFKVYRSILRGFSNGSGGELVPVLTAPPPSDEAIAQVAYEKYLAREGRHGFDQDDWAEARRELVAEALMISHSQKGPLDA